MTTHLTPEEKVQRKELFGTFRDGLRTNKSYRWQHNGDELIEIPVTTFPVAKVPIHISYILYLSMFSTRLALFYFETAIRLCQAWGMQPSLLMHPLDFLGVDDNLPELAFFPAMGMRSQDKIEVVGEVLERLKKRYDVVTLKQHAVTVLKSSHLPLYWGCDNQDPNSLLDFISV